MLIHCRRFRTTYRSQLQRYWSRDR